MKKLLIVLLVCAVPLVSFTLLTSSSKAEVEDLVLNSYINGAFNALDPDAMQVGFDPNFAIYSAKGNELAKYPIADWVASVRKRKADPNFDPSKNVWKHKFSNVSISGNAATMQVDLSKDGKHVYTDYLSLLKFDDGWRIVAKVYYKHP